MFLESLKRCWGLFFVVWDEGGGGGGSIPLAGRSKM